MGKRQGIGYRRRFDVLKRDGFACRYCGQRPPDVVLTLDHIVPVSRGGTDEMSNLCACCFACNLGKSDGRVYGDTLCAYYRREQQKHELPLAQRLAEEAANDALDAEHAAVAGGAVAERHAVRPILKLLRARLGKPYDDHHIELDLRDHVRDGVSVARLLAEALDCSDYLDFRLAAASLAGMAVEDAERLAAKAMRAANRAAEEA